MSLRARIGAAAVVITVAACNAVSGIDDLTFDAECTAGDPSPCDDGNACTLDACDGDSCAHDPLPDGDQPVQTPGDCKRAICAGGHPDTTGDADDIEDDGEECTHDACSDDGTILHTPVPEGTACSVGQASGTCGAEGTCVIVCSATQPCAADGEPCTDDICDVGTGTCTYAPLNGIPTPGAAPAPGDCRVHMCVAGKDENVVDDTDVPDDGAECTVDACSGGVPSNLPLVIDTPCGPGGTLMCDGGSICGECNTTTQCFPNDPPDTFCAARACTAHVCEMALKPSGTLLPVQTDLDCQALVCDGAGGEKAVVDNANLPEDNNPCTSDICSGGVPQNTNVPAGTSCGPSSVCGGGAQSGMCVGCNVPTDCPGVDDFCKTRTCIANVCAYSFTADGTPFTPANQIVGDCLERQCDGVGNEKQIAKNTDLPDDANNCTNDVCTMGAPSNPPKAIDTQCTGPLAPGGGFCDGIATCYECNTAPQCPTAPVCMTTTCNAHACGQTPTAPNTPIAMQTPKDCKLVVCDGAGGLMTIADTGDIPDDGNPCTQDFCNGSTPVNMNLAAGTPCGAGLVCSGNGVCGKAQGQPCATGAECATGFCADGVCCSAACNGTCQGCTLALTNLATGTCGNIKSGTEDTAPVCNGPSACDGMGNCKFDNGQACSSAGQCVSGFCADGVCCGSACTASCLACTNALTGGATGTCGNVLLGLEDGALCNGPNACDGSGNCKEDNGQTCSTAGECSSGFCADGVCCNVACGGVCKACAAALNGGVSGVCGNIVALVDDDNSIPVCSGAQTCDGAGVCKKDNGQACTAGQCASGNCVDGFCCNTACGGTCQACAAALNGGSNGVCGNITAGLEDASPVCNGANSCDGAGACKLDNAQMCTIGSQCVSGFCADGFCCNTACSAVCQACSQAKKGSGANGTCGNVATGTDPDAECSPDPVSTCGNDGTCGAGACRKYVAGTVCQASSCAGTLQSDPDTCDGNGLCVDGGTTSCLPFVCGPTACLTSCILDTDCSSSMQYCSGGACVNKKAAGAACSGANQCSAGFCVDGVCCVSECPACLACNVSGNGTCTNIALFFDDNSGPNTCNGSFTCNGSGLCKLDNGQSCAANGDCASGNCTGAPKTCQ